MIEFKKFINPIGNFIYSVLENRGKLLAWVIGIVSVLYIIAFNAFCVDDAFITFRYGRNLIENGIWNWNATTELVEAYTSSLYGFLCIIPHALNMSPALFFDLFSLFILYFLYKKIKNNSETKYSLFLTLFILLLSPITFVHLSSGLETPLFVLVMFDSYLLFSKIIEKNENKYKRLYFNFLLLPFIRPDGALVSLILFIALVYKKRAIKNFGFLSLMGLIGVVYFYVRYKYFGYLLPNPIYEKYSSPPEWLFMHNLRGAKIFIILMFTSFIAGQKKFVDLIAVVISLIFVYCYAKAELMMNYSFRFFFQALIPAILFITLRINKKNNILMILMIASILYYINNSFRGINYSYNYMYSLNNSYGEFGRAVSEFKDDKFVLATGDCGILPYEAGWNVVDLMGLANVEIAHNNISVKYLKKVNPDLILGYSRTDGKPNIDDTGISFTTLRDKVVNEYVNMDDRYEYVDSFSNGSYYMVSYLRKDNVKFNEVSKVIKDVSLKTKDFFDFGFWNVLKFNMNFYFS